VTRALLFPLLLIVLGGVTLSVIAGDVLQRDPDELMLRLDRQTRVEARLLASWPYVRPAATVVSRLSGEGLVLGVVAASAALLVLRRHRDATILLAGTLSAWALTGLLSPSAGAAARPPRWAITATASGHAVVTVVACACWPGRGRRRPGVRLSRGLVVVARGAAARVIRCPSSDVAVGLAAGTLCRRRALAASWRERSAS
jgi:hypothetical protein